MTTIRGRIKSATVKTLGPLQEEIRARITEISGGEWSSAMQLYNMVMEANLNPHI